LLSHYFFWRESPQQGHSLLDRFREEGMTIIDFAQIPLIANVYNGVFFVDADIEQFEFVGDFSRFSGDVSRLAEKLGTILETPRLRQNPNSAYQAEVARVKADPSMMTELKRLLAADIEFYERATSS
jgi:hypothetical protein